MPIPELASFVIGVLPAAEAEREFKRPQRARILVGGRIAKGLLVVPPPHSLPRLIGDQSRRVQMISVDEVELGRGRRSR